MISLLTALAIAGCSASTAERGTVEGSFLQIGGPPQLVGGRPVQPKPIPLSGTVVARSQTGHVFIVTVGTDGRFRMFVPAGTYRLTGHSPMYPGPCAGEGVIKVRAGKYTAHTIVVCVAA